MDVLVIKKDSSKSGFQHTYCTKSLTPSLF